MLFVSTGTTTGYPIMDTARVNWVETFGSGSIASDGFYEQNLEWVGQGAPGRVIKSQGNAANPTHIRGSPPKNSFAALWGVPANDADQLFTVLLDQGDIIRVNISFTVYFGQSAAITGLGGFTGYVWYNALASNSGQLLLSTADQAAATNNLWA